MEKYGEFPVVIGCPLVLTIYTITNLIIWYYYLFSLDIYNDLWFCFRYDL